MFKGFVFTLTAIVASLFSLAAASPEKNKIVLSKNNMVSMASEFTSKSVAEIMLAAQALNDKLPRGEPLYLVLNSPGGSIEAGLELIDNMNALGRTVHTVSLFSASMAFQTVQGLSGNRYLTPTGILMSHKARGGFEGEFPGQLDSRYQFYLRRIGKLDEQTVARSKGLLTLESYRTLYENEYWCEGQDCVNKGLADEVVPVTCDKTLNGTEKELFIIPFGMLDVKATVTKAACPTITGILDVKFESPEEDVPAEDYFTKAQLEELRKIVEERINGVNPLSVKQ